MLFLSDCRGSVFLTVGFFDRITGAQPLEVLQKMGRKTTTSFQQVKLAQLPLWSSPEMLLRETMKQMCSSWYDHSNVKSLIGAKKKYILG